MSVKTIETGIPGLIIIEPVVHGDARGFFMETWNAARYKAVGLPGQFVQSNLSRSGPGVIRGLHYQNPEPQGKLVSVLEGRVFDVAVDIRPDSPSFRQWAGVELSAENHRQLYVPEGFAHGFCVLSAEVVVEYKCTDVYNPGDELGLIWNDPDIGINWPIDQPLLSQKDSAALRLCNLMERLPHYRRVA